MNLFAALRQRRQPAQGFGQAKAAPEADLHQTFILEPILTPSGLVDVGEDLPEVADLDIDLGLDGEDGFDPVDTDLPDGDDLADADLEEIPFIENLDIGFQFESGYFTVGESGEVTIDYLFDGGEYQGELAIFSLEGMELLEPGSEEFIQMAAERAVSNTEQGYIVISDKTEGARFNSSMSGELSNWNSESYQGAKTFQMKAGDTFGFMLVPKGEISEVAANPAIDGAKTPLFSLATSNPDDMLAFGQIADVFGDGNTFVLEDMRVDGKSDLDYNDVIFRVKGATGYTALLDDVLGDVPDWRYTELGQRVLAVDSEFDNPGKEIAGLAAYPANPDPLVPINPIPQAGVDQGGNGLSGSGDGQLNRGGAWSNSPTELSASYVNDIIDQVGSQDALDLYQVKAQELDGSQVTILQGETRVAFLSSDGNVIGEQVLGRGVHTLDLPDGTSGEVTLRFAAHNGSDATYMLSGFESQNPEPFNIDVEFADGITTSQRQIIQQAIRSIEALIVAGSPSAIVDGKIIDDVKFKMSVENLDGNGGTLARTKIDFMRYASLLPAQSLVQFDADDLARLEAEGKLFNVVQHELLHGLGFGNLWEAKGLVDFAGTPVSRYTGEQAVEKLKELGGQTDYIDLERSGEGSADLHWHEGLFQDELMTADLGFLLDQDGKPYSPMSPITLASLADLGYEVNWDQADNNWGLGGSSRPGDFEPNLDELSEEARAGLAALAAELEELKNSQPETPIAPILDIDPVDPTTISPEIWAHAERFDNNGEYYDWQKIRVGHWTQGHTIWNYVMKYMTHPSKHDHRSANAKANDPAYWQFIVDRNRAFGINRPQLIYEGQELYVPIWNANYEQEQAELQAQMEAELQAQLEAERKERERKEELYRQSGSGGLDWYLSKPLPDFGQQAPFETSVRDVVGSVVPDDYFRFTVSRTGWVTVYLADLLADADLYLYDSRNRLIGQATRDGVTDEKIITQLQPGTYLVRVNSSDGKATDYDLKVRFDGLQTRTQSGGRVGGRGPLFSDPRIQRIYDTALENFAAPERAKANAKIAALQAEKRQHEREMEALLAKMNGEQRAKIHQALDDGRHYAHVWVDNIANPIKGTVDSLANGIIDKANSIANGLLGTVDGIWDFGNGWIKDRKEDARRFIRDGRDAVINAVNGARSWLKGKLHGIQEGVKSAIWWFFERIKNAYRTGAEINQAIANAANTFRNEVDNAVRGANDLVNQFKGKVLSAADWTRSLNVGFSGFSLNAYDHVVKPAVDAISGGVSSTINGIGNVLNGVTDWLEPRTQKAVAAIVDALFGDKTGHLWNKINKVDEKIAATRTGLEKAIATAGQYIANVTNQIQTFLSDPEERKRVLEALWKWGITTIDDVYNFIVNKRDEVRKEIKAEEEERKRAEEEERKRAEEEKKRKEEEERWLKDNTDLNEKQEDYFKDTILRGKLSLVNNYDFLKKVSQTQPESLHSLSGLFLPQSDTLDKGFLNEDGSIFDTFSYLDVLKKKLGQTTLEKAGEAYQSISSAINQHHFSDLEFNDRLSRNSSKIAQQNHSNLDAITAKYEAKYAFSLSDSLKDAANGILRSFGLGLHFSRIFLEIKTLFGKGNLKSKFSKLIYGDVIGPVPVKEFTGDLKSAYDVIKSIYDSKDSIQDAVVGIEDGDFSKMFSAVPKLATIVGDIVANLPENVKAKISGTLSTEFVKAVQNTEDLGNLHRLLDVLENTQSKHISPDDIDFVYWARVYAGFSALVNITKTMSSIFELFLGFEEVTGPDVRTVSEYLNAVADIVESAKGAAWTLFEEWNARELRIENATYSYWNEYYHSIANVQYDIVSYIAKEVSAKAWGN